MPYSYVSLTQALSHLGQRLYDPTSVFWTDVEKTVYIQEALRTWNAHANFWRGEFVFNSTQNTNWYNITDLAVAPNTLRPLTVTDVDIYRAIQYHLLEPPTGAVWSGSLQFNVQDMLQAVQRRRDELISSSGCTITKSTVAAVAGRTLLADTVIDVRRVCWLPTAGFGYSITPLCLDDTFALMSYENDYTVQTPGNPSSFQQSTEPPLSFDVDVPPAIPGQYELLTVDAGAALSTGASTVIVVPDDFAWVIKFGAMADMLNRDSNAKDSIRAQYCNLRYLQGLTLLLNSSAILGARINNLPVGVDSVWNQDRYDPTWQAAAASSPGIVLAAGLNYISLAPTPDAGPYSITLSVVENAPIPTTGNDPIQVGRDIYDAILDYAQHLASFKMGGAEFISTIPLFQRFIKQAANYNSKLDALGEYTKSILEMSQLESQSNPVYSDVNYTPGQEGGRP